MKKVIIIEDSPTFCNMLGKKLEAKGWKTILCYNYRDGLKAVKESSEWDVVISDMRLGNDNGIDLLEWMRSNGYQNPFIIMTSYDESMSAVRTCWQERSNRKILRAYDESMSAVRTMKLGAEDYIPKKLLLDVVYERLEEIIDKQKRLVELNNKIVYRKSEKFRRIYKMAELFAKSDMAVMILGDNGTGKEHIAEKIHLQSKRADKPFEVVDCGTLSAELAVSALFGHEKGAFTSADAARKGYFEMAAGGTLFLDEIGNLPKDVQAMLLRVLQSKSYRPLGATKDKVADVRIIAATNENLQEAVREGRFRSDLYYRLHEAVIEIPRLRDCKEDIMPLANFFLKLYDRHTDKEIKCISKEAQRALVSHTWPGNVRELKSCIMRAMLLCENEIIDVEDLQLSQSALTDEALDFDEQERKINRERILWALKQCNGIKRDAAKMLEMSHTTFYARMKEYGIPTNKL